MIEATILLAKGPMGWLGNVQKNNHGGEKHDSRQYCTRRNKDNHSRENHFEIIGYPPSWKRLRPRKDQY